MTVDLKGFCECDGCGTYGPTIYVDGYRFCPGCKTDYDLELKKDQEEAELRAEPEIEAA